MPDLTDLTSWGQEIELHLLHTTLRCIPPRPPCPSQNFLDSASKRPYKEGCLPGG
jgi:hypothetical protein